MIRPMLYPNGIVVGLTAVGRVRSPQSTIAYVSGGSSAYDLGTRSRFLITLSGATTELATPGDVQAGDQWTVEVVQDATGSRALTFSSAYDFGAAGTPVLAALAAGKRALISCVAKSSTKIDAVYAGNFGA